MKTILLIIAFNLGAIPIVLSQSAEQYQSKDYTQGSKKFYTKIYPDYHSEHPESYKKLFNLPNGNAGDNISHWKWQNILPQGNNLNSITIAYTPKNGAGEFVGYGVGNYGTIVKSSLNGNGWQDLSDNLPTHSNLSSVSFADSQTGITGANDGFIFLTYNGGVNWEYEVPNDFSAITCVQMISHNDVYLCEEDGQIVYSSDGGINWIVKASLGGRLNWINFYDVNKGIAAGYKDSAFIVRTTNAGLTWTNVSPAGVSFELRNIDFVDGNVAYAVGDGGCILKSENGGLSWTLQTSGINEPLQSVSFFNSQQGWAVGGGPYFSSKLLYTSNGGDTWVENNFPTFVTLNSVFVTDFNQAFFCGNGGLIFRSNEDKLVGTYSYERLVSGADANIFSCDFINASTGYAVGNPGFAFGGSVYKTTNGGVNWTNPPSGIFTFMLDVDFIDEHTGFTGGGGGSVFKTTNGALSWSLMNLGITNDVDGIRFINSNTGIVITDSGKILRTTNSGNNWSQQNSGTSQDLNGVSLPALSSFYVCGNNGVILKSTNQGNTWVFQNSGLTDGLEQIFFINSNTGWIIGGSNKIIKTTNGGTNWFGLTPNLQTRFPSDIRFINASTGFMSNGDGGVVFRSTNGGSSWNTVFGLAPLYDGGTSQIAPIGDSICYAVGSEGAIMKFGSGGNASLVLSISATTEGMVYNCSYSPDTITTVLRSNVSPYNKIDSGKRKMDELNVVESMIVSFFNAQPGTYYVVLKHRNSIETWSSAPMTFTGSNDGFTILNDPDAVFGQNVILTCPGFYAMYSGDVNQDGSVDLTDIVNIFNDANMFVAGYVVTDLTNDEFVDLTDLTIAFNNSNNFIGIIRP